MKNLTHTILLVSLVGVTACKSGQAPSASIAADTTREAGTMKVRKLPADTAVRRLPVVPIQKTKMRLD